MISFVWLYNELFFIDGVYLTQIKKSSFLSLKRAHLDTSRPIYLHKDGQHIIAIILTKQVCNESYVWFQICLQSWSEKELDKLGIITMSTLYVGWIWWNFLIFYLMMKNYICIFSHMENHFSSTFSRKKFPKTIIFGRKSHFSPKKDDFQQIFTEQSKAKYQKQSLWYIWTFLRLLVKRFFPTNSNKKSNSDLEFFFARHWDQEIFKCHYFVTGYRCA